MRQKVMRQKNKYDECDTNTIMNKLNRRLIFFLFQSLMKSTSLPGGGVNVFAALLHTHLAGNVILDYGHWCRTNVEIRKR